MRKTLRLAFIQTGGTIDKDYPQVINSFAFEIADPAVGRILPLTNPNFSWRIIELLKKDSTELTDKDRQLIVSTCKEIPEKEIIITHGTDTMVETAKALSSIKNKVIVLTGALRPEKFVDSDASFNIGTAIGALEYLPQGVYIAMSGRVYAWDTCKKDNTTCQFVFS